MQLTNEQSTSPRARTHVTANATLVILWNPTYVATSSSSGGGHVVLDQADVDALVEFEIHRRLSVLAGE